MTLVMSRRESVSDTAVRAARGASHSLSERALIDLVVAEVLAAHPAGGLVDSVAVADVVWDRRRHAGRDSDRTQCKDYVQYLFRESRAHVCRHADGHHYRLHAAAVCSPECDSKHEHGAPREVRAHCPSCFLEVTTTGVCPLGC